MRKPLDEMTPEELRIEKWWQEEHFRHLVSDMQPVRPVPTTRFGNWWLKWGEVITTTTKIVVGTVLFCAVVSGAMWFFIACLSTL
jgi:hypothetical protein